MSLNITQGFVRIVQYHILARGLGQDMCPHTLGHIVYSIYNPEMQQLLTFETPANIWYFCRINYLTNCFSAALHLAPDHCMSRYTILVYHIAKIFNVGF